MWYWVVVGGDGWSRIFFQRKINVNVLISWTTVSHGSVICVSRPFNMRYWSVLTVTCPEVDRSTTSVERTSTDTYSIPDAREPDKHKKRSSTENLYPVASVRSFEHVQNLPTAKTGQNGYCLTRNAFTAWGTDEKRMCTDTNEQRILLSFTRPLALSGKVWQSHKSHIQNLNVEYRISN